MLAQPGDIDLDGILRNFLVIGKQPVDQFRLRKIRSGAFKNTSSKRSSRLRNVMVVPPVDSVPAIGSNCRFPDRRRLELPPPRRRSTARQRASSSEKSNGLVM